MVEPSTPSISTRKAPKQARSESLVAAILQAAAQVLAEVGTRRFTTARVAERAGVSIGSLYQYFPNKAAILFRLQSDEWRDTNALLSSILENCTKPPPERLRTAVHAFVRSECEEAAMRLALRDAAPFFRDAPEAEEPRAAGARTLQAFLRAALPAHAEPTRLLTGELIAVTLGGVGEWISEAARDAAEIEAYADALADMLCAYVEHLRRRDAGVSDRRHPEA